MALPCGTTGSLCSSFLPDRLVCLPVKHPYAITLCDRLPIGLRVPLEASVTLLEATTPVKLPTIQCPRFCGLELKQPKGRISTATPQILAYLIQGLWLGSQYYKGGIPRMTPHRLASMLHSLPPILYM